MALDYLRTVYRDPLQPDSVRIRAAMACLPFETPKLSVVASVNDPTAFAERLEAAIRRSGINPRVIEQHRVIEHQPSQPGDVTGSMLGTDRKLRRL